MTTFIFLIVYLAFGFLFMTNCAKFGWMDKYDPAIFYWIAWPIVILTAGFRLISNIVSKANTVLENYINTLKPEQYDNT